MIRRRVTIHVDEDDRGTWRMTATISAPFLRGKSIWWRANLTKTATIKYPYADELSGKLLIAWTDALKLVSAGYYEDIELPFDAG